MDIMLKEAILHILDRESGSPVFSQVPLDLTKEYIRDYLTKKIQKLTNPQTKTGTLTQDAPFTQLVQACQENFIEASEGLTKRWYDSYAQCEDAPSCDVFVVRYEVDVTPFVAFLKVNYHEGYTHFVEGSDSGVANQLIINRALLANKTQKADEGLMVNLETLFYGLVEKRYTFSGEKRLYFSEEVIETEPQLSLEDNVKVITKVAAKIGQKFEAAQHDLVADVKESIYDSIEDSGEVDVNLVAEKVFKDNITAQLSFKEEVAEKGFVDRAPMVEEVRELTEKKYGKQKLRLSNGIELIVPLDVYRDPNLIEFINNPDGTISVTIKNVEDVINRL